MGVTSCATLPFLPGTHVFSTVFKLLQANSTLFKHLWLVTVKGLNAQKSTYRTFIATDGGRRWCIGVSSSLTLKELATWLAAPGALGNFRVETALNLDGGSSSAFWCHETGISYPAFKQVRNYLGVAPVERR